MSVPAKTSAASRAHLPVSRRPPVWRLVWFRNKSGRQRLGVTDHLLPRRGAHPSDGL